MSAEPHDVPEEPAGPPPQDVLTRRQRSASAGVGIAAGGAGVAAVFLTSNELGSAALMAAGVYFLLASLLGRFPKLSFGGNEIDPSEVARARRESTEAKSDSGEAKEGVGETLERLARLEAKVGGPGDVAGRRPGASAGRGEDEGMLPGSPVPAGPVDVDLRLVRLAQEYNEVRWTMPSGSERTKRMTRIVASMIDLCQEVEVPDVDGLLGGEDRGRRLLGVAYLNARPDPSRIPQLVTASVTEDKPFNEFWALQTLRKTVHDNCDRLTPDLRLRLQGRLDALPRGIDRWRWISAILSDCP